jgi:hypothetical protein
MAKLLSGVSLGCVVLFGILGRGIAHGTGISQAEQQAIARLAPPQASDWDLQKGFGPSFSVNPVYRSMDPRGGIKLMDDGLQGPAGFQRDALDLSFKGSLPGGLRGEGQFASTAATSQAEKWFRQYRNQLSRLRMSGSSGSLEYGGEYRSIGPGFRRGPGMNWRLDQEGGESWISQSFGLFKIKGMFSEFHDNLDEDPGKPRNTRRLGGTALSVSLPWDTSLSISYQRGTLQTVGGRSRLMEDNSVNTYGASLYSWHSMWDASLSTEFSEATNILDSSRRANYFYHEASATFRPTEDFYIMPSLSLMQEHHSWDGLQTLTPMAMIALTYTHPSRLFSLSSYGYYSRTTASDGSYDVKTANFVTSLEVPLSSNTSISFDVMFNQYKDRVYNVNSYQETLGRVMYRVFRF